MFIRSKEVLDKKTGKKYSYHRLVESYSLDGSIKQRNVLYLGKLDLPKEELKILGKLIEKRINGQKEDILLPELSDLADAFYEKYLEKLAEANLIKQKQDNADYREIDIKTISTENHRSFGSEFVLNAFWKKLGLDKILSEVHFSNKEKAIAKALILGRIISPGSELHTYNWHQKRSSLNEFPGYDLSGVSKDSYYSVGDFLYNFKDIIESRLRENLQREFNLKETIYLYDLTNTYFESSKKGSTIACYGKSKEKRYDCPLVTLALVVDNDGFPIYSKIFKGNQSEPQTLPMILEKVLKSNFSGKAVTPQISIAMDRGIAISENIEYLKSQGYSYFVIERRDTVKDFKKEFSDKSDFTKYTTKANEKVYLKKVETSTSAQVLVYSEGKALKENSIVTKKEEHLMVDIEKLIKSNKNGNIVKPQVIGERIGRLRQKYGSVASGHKFDLVFDPIDSKRVIEINHTVSDKKRPVKKEYAGCYVIETDKKDYNEKEIWDIYMQLHQVESAFRAMKSELGTRPIYHQKDERIKSHLFISVLAYSLMKSVTFELGKQKYYTSWSSLNKLLSTHQRSTITMETKNLKKLSVRVSGKPEESHKRIYQLLNLTFKEYRVMEEITNSS